MSNTTNTADNTTNQRRWVDQTTCSMLWGQTNLEATIAVDGKFFWCDLLARRGGVTETLEEAKRLCEISISKDPRVTWVTKVITIEKTRMRISVIKA